MRVLLIGFFTRTYMPYMEKYESVLKEKGISYDVALFDRDSTEKEILCSNNEYTFAHKTTASRLKKLVPVVKYSFFVKKMIRKNRYDKIIVFTTMPAVLCKGILLKKYKEKFIYDYRDTTYEKFSVFKRAVVKIIDASAFTAVSSKGYTNVLGENDKFVFNHNISNIVDSVKSAKELNGHVTIGFLGYVRYFDVNSRLVDALKNDDKYSLLYVGTQFSDCDLVSYANSIGASNVKVTGKFDNGEKAKLYKDIQIINSMYSTNSDEVQYAIPNRLYDAALFKIPLMTTKGTYLSEITEKYGLGFSVDPFCEDIKIKIDEYVSCFNPEAFNDNCNAFLNEVLMEESRLREKIEEFLSE